MLARSSLGRGAQRASTLSCRASKSSRSMATAAAATGSSLYQSSDAAGIKIAGAESGHPTTTLAVVAKAGTRYQPAPGLTQGLSAYAFKSTENRSALRINRESELLGGQLSSYHTRESVVVQAKFLKEDFPFYAELLAEVISKTKFLPHEYPEEVQKYLHEQQAAWYASPSAVAVNAAHSVAFHTGVGLDVNVLPGTSLGKYVSAESVKSFASAAYNKSNIAVVASGTSAGDVSQWVSQFFSGVPAGSAISATSAPKYYGGEERISHPKNAYTIAFPGSSAFASGQAAYKPELTVLAALLGGKSTIKWSSGFSLLGQIAAKYPGVSIDTTLPSYSDSGLLAITFEGSPDKIAASAKDAVATLKSISSGDIPKEALTKAIALAKFDALEAGATAESQLLSTGVSLLNSGKTFEGAEVAKALTGVTAASVSKAAKTLLGGKASVAAVGDLHALPWAEDLGLTV